VLMGWNRFGRDGFEGWGIRAGGVDVIRLSSVRGSLGEGFDA